MPFALVTIGLIMVITGAKNTYAQFGAQLKSDFTGAGNFTYWVAALGAIGALGYVEPLREMSRYLMALVIIVMLIANNKSGGKGFFERFKDALAQGPVASGTTTQSTSTANSVTNGQAALSIGADLLATAFT